MMKVDYWWYSAKCWVKCKLLLLFVSCQDFAAKALIPGIIILTMFAKICKQIFKIHQFQRWKEGFGCLLHQWPPSKPFPRHSKGSVPRWGTWQQSPENPKQDNHNKSRWDPLGFNSLLSFSDGGDHLRPRSPFFAPVNLRRGEVSLCRRGGCSGHLEVEGLHY